MSVYLKIDWWDDYLGHGRFTEVFLIGVEFLYTILFIVSWWLDIPPIFIAFSEFNDYLGFLPVPFAISGVVSLAGLLLHAHGYESSRWFRVAGATIGMSIWLFILGNGWRLGTFFAGGSPWMIMAIPASLWIIR